MAAKQKPKVEEQAPAPPPERRRLAEGFETRADLYAEARRRGIEGRSKMTKAELLDALGRR